VVLGMAGMSPSVLVWSAVFCNVAGLVLCRFWRVSSLLYGAGTAFTAAAAVLPWRRTGVPPVAYPRGVFLVLGAGLYLPYVLLLLRGRRRGVQAVFPAAASAVLLLSFLFPPGSPSSLPSVLRCGWFLPHVLSYVAAYLLLIGAFGVEAGLLMRGAVRRGREGEEGDLARKLVRAAFPLLTCGLALGVFWADAAWGAAWSWDPKETWALVTWILYALYLLCTETPSLRRYAAWYHAAAFTALILTLVGVNLLPALRSPFHGY